MMMILTKKEYEALSGKKEAKELLQVFRAEIEAVLIKNTQIVSTIKSGFEMIQLKDFKQLMKELTTVTDNVEKQIDEL